MTEGDDPGPERSADLVDRAWRLFDFGAAEWLLGVIGDEDLVACAVAALALGCDSSSLASIAILREHDRRAILTGMFGAFRERNLEFPLSDDALKLAADGALTFMLRRNDVSRGGVGQAVEHR